MPRALTSLVALLALVAGTAAQSPTRHGSAPCIPEGSSTVFAGDVPDLQGGGYPSDANWASAPHAFDHDTFSSDDYVGECTLSADGRTMTVEVRNVGGHLFGPSGFDLEGGLKGDCIELYMTRAYWYTGVVRVCTSEANTIGAGGSGTTSGEEYCVDTRRNFVVWYRTGQREICPC